MINSLKFKIDRAVETHFLDVCFMEYCFHYFCFHLYSFSNEIYLFMVNFISFCFLVYSSSLFLIVKLKPFILRIIAPSIDISNIVLTFLCHISYFFSCYIVGHFSRYFCLLVKCFYFLNFVTFLALLAFSRTPWIFLTFCFGGHAFLNVFFFMKIP